MPATAPVTAASITTAPVTATVPARIATHMAYGVAVLWASSISIASSATFFNRHFIILIIIVRIN